MRPTFFVVLLLMPTACFADDVLVCDPAHPLIPGAVTRVQYAVDPGNLWGQSGYLIWRAPNDTMTAQEVTAMNQLRGQIDAIKPIPHRYWMCTDTAPVDGVLESVREMTTAEKATLDAPELAEQARQQAFDNEIATNDLCTASLADIESRIDTEVATLQTQLDATGTAAEVKAHLRNQLYPKLGAVFKKLGKCLKARLR